MEAENRRCRKEHVNAERKRLIRLTEAAYNVDPRIQQELKAIEEEKQRKKNEKWEYKRNKKQAEADIENKLKEEKASAEKAIQDQDKANAEARKVLQIAFKQRVKDLIELLKVKLTGTRYDRFWVEAILKKFRTIERIEEVIQAVIKLESNSQEEAVKEFEAALIILNETEAEAAERVKQQAIQAMMKEEQKKEEFTDENWTNEEVKLLTKGIARYPPGTTQRWKVIADFVGTKSQKEAIKKA